MQKAAELVYVYASSRVLALRRSWDVELSADRADESWADLTMTGNRCRTSAIGASPLRCASRLR